jgi:catechol 2,3-dioxygenase-like lactoylglutathione lyase family enzyme
VSVSVSRLGVCVSDLDAFTRFYSDGLGFEQVAAHEIGEQFSGLMELDGVRLPSRLIAKDGVTLELLGYDAPGTTGDGTRRPMNRLGSTHICLRVDDVEATADAIEGPGARSCVRPGPPSRWERPCWNFCIAPIPTGCASS